MSLSHVWLFASPCTAAHHASLSFTISWSLLRLVSIESMMPSNHLILCHWLLLTSVFSSIGVFSNELALCIRWPEYWSFSFSISPSSGYSGLISFRILFWSCCPRGSWESSPAPQSKSINSSLLSLLYGPTPTWLQKSQLGLIWTFVSKIFSSVDLLISVPCCLVWYSLIVSWKGDRVDPTYFAF